MTIFHQALIADLHMVPEVSSVAAELQVSTTQAN